MPRDLRVHRDDPLRTVVLKQWTMIRISVDRGCLRRNRGRPNSIFLDAMKIPNQSKKRKEKIDSVEQLVVLKSEITPRPSSKMLAFGARSEDQFAYPRLHAIYRLCTHGNALKQRAFQQ